MKLSSTPSAISGVELSRVHSGHGVGLVASKRNFGNSYGPPISAALETEMLFAHLYDLHVFGVSVSIPMVYKRYFSSAGLHTTLELWRNVPRSSSV